MGCRNRNSNSKIWNIPRTPQHQIRIPVTTFQRGPGRIVRHIQQLEIILNYIINPKFAGFDLERVVAANDEELLQFWRSRVAKISENYIRWELKVRPTTEEKEPILPIKIAIRSTGIPDALSQTRQILLTTNLIKAGEVYPQLQQFVDPRTKQLDPARLQEILQNFFNLPEGMQWYPRNITPDFDSYYRDRERIEGEILTWQSIAIIGKFGSSERNTTDAQIILTRKGDVELLIIAPPDFLPRIVPY